MPKMSKERYTPEFKAEVLKLVIEQGHGITATSARMGISKSTIHTWVWVSRARLGFASSPQGGKAVRSDSETDIRRLRQALTRAEMARDILKKAIASCAKDTLRGTHS